MFIHPHTRVVSRARIFWNSSNGNISIYASEDPTEAAGEKEEV